MTELNPLLQVAGNIRYLAGSSDKPIAVTIQFSSDAAAQDFYEAVTKVLDTVEQRSAMPAYPELGEFYGIRFNIAVERGEAPHA